MSLLSDIVNRMRGNKTNVTLTPETPVKKPEVLLTINKPAVGPQADKNQATLNKIVPGRSILSQVAEKKVTPTVGPQADANNVALNKIVPGRSLLSQAVDAKKITPQFLPTQVDTYRIKYYQDSPEYNEKQKSIITEMLKTGKPVSQFDIDYNLKKNGEKATSTFGGVLADIGLLFHEGVKQMKEGDAYVISPMMTRYKNQEEADMYEKEAIQREVQGTKKRFVGSMSASVPLVFLNPASIGAGIFGGFMVAGNTDKGKIVLDKFNEYVISPIGDAALKLGGDTITEGLSEQDREELRDTIGFMIFGTATHAAGKRLLTKKPGTGLSKIVQDVSEGVKGEIFANNPELKKTYAQAQFSVHPDRWTGDGIAPEITTLAGDAAKKINVLRDDFAKGIITKEIFKAEVERTVSDFAKNKERIVSEKPAPIKSKEEINKEIKEAVSNTAEMIVKEEGTIIKTKAPKLTKTFIDTVKNNYNLTEPQERGKFLRDTLTDLGYIVDYYPAKKTNSEYLTIKKKGATEGDVTTIRLSDHGESKQRIQAYGEKDFLFDKNSKIDLPIKDIIAKIEEGKIPERVKPDYKDSEMVKAFNNRIDRFSNEELASYAISQENPAQLQNNARDELARRTSVEEEMNLYDTVQPKKFEGEVQTVVDTTVPSDLTTLSDNQLALLETKDPTEQDAIVAEYQRRGISDEQWIELQSNATPEARTVLPTNKELKARTEGFTYDTQNGGFYEAGKTDGIAVAPFPNRSQFIEGKPNKMDFRKIFKDYVKKNADLIAQGYKVGGFFSTDRGGYVLDISVIIPTSERDFAIQLGKDTNQEGIFDMSVNPEEGYIPTNGTGLVPPGFDENNFINIISPYLSKQPTYASTSNITRGPITNVGGETGPSSGPDVGQNVSSTELVSPFGESTNIPKDSPLVYKKNESTFEKKSGYEIDTTNTILTGLMVGGVAATTMIPVVGPAIAMTVGVSLSPIAIGSLLSPKTFDTLFFKQRVLNAFRDENGITALHAITNEDTNNLFRIKNFIDEFGMQKHIDALAENEKGISDAFDTVWENIDGILSEDTYNLLSGDKLGDSQKKSIKNIFIASIGSNNFRKLFLNFETDMAIKKFMAIENLYRYQPGKVKAILKSVAPELIPLLERQGELLADIDKGYAFGYDALVEGQILTSKDDSDRYVHYLVLAETYKYDYKKGVNDTQGYDNLFELLAAKELEYSLADDQKRADMQSEISRLRTSILKEKSDDVMDVYRVHSPLAQFLDYAVNYSETVTRKQKLDIIEKINELDPVAVGTKKVLMSNIFNVTLIDDMFFPNKVNLPSLVEIERTNRLYGIENSSSLEIQKHNLGQKIAGATVDVLGGALKGAYWMIGGLAQVSQGIYSVVIMNSPGLIKSGVRIVRFGTFKNTQNTGKFFMQNKLSARHTQKNLTSTNAIEQIRMRNEYSKFGINAVYRTSGNIGSALDASSQFFFGGPAEVSISEHVIMNEIFALMDAKNPGAYKTEGGIDAQKVMDDFNALTQGEKNKELARLRTLAQSLYDGITDSNSGISLFRVPFMKFFNRFVSSSASQSIGRFADVRSLLRDTMKSPSVKEAIKTFSSDKNKAYRASGLKIMSIIITLSIVTQVVKQMLQSIGCERGDEECNKKQEALSYTVVNRMFGISMQKAILSAIGGLPSTPFGFYDKLIFNVYEFIQGVVTDNDSMKSIALTNIINSLGFIKNIVNLTTGQKVGLTSYLNATELTNTDFSYWFSHNVSRGYTTPAEKAKVWDAMAKNPDVDFDGLYILMNQANKVSDLEYTDSFNGIARILNSISPALAKLLLEDNTITETEDFVSARTTAVGTFEDVRLITHAIDTTDGSLMDITEAAALALGAQNNPGDLNYVSQISKNFASMRKKNVDIAEAFDSSFRAFGMTITAADLKDGKAMIEKMKRSPYIYASYLKSIQTLSEADNKYDGEEDLKKLFSTGIKSTDPIYDAIAYHEQAPEYANSFVSSLKKSMGDTYIKGSKDEVTQKLSTLEAYLQIGAGSDLLSGATLRGVQIAMGSQFESNILDLTEKGVYSPIEYPYIAEAVIALADARSMKPVKTTDVLPAIDMYRAAKNPKYVDDAAKNTPKKITPVENYEGTTIQGATVMDIEGAAWNHGVALVHEKGSPVYAPVSGVVVDTGYVVGMGHTIKIQDYNGNILQYSNLDGYNAQTGDFIVQGYQVGKMKGNIAQATLFSKKNEIMSPAETTGYMNTSFTAKKKSTPTMDAPPVKDRKTIGITPGDSRFRHSSARQDWTLGETPVEEIVKRELANIMNSDDVSSIDFGALSSKIKSKSKSKKVGIMKPKSVPSVMEAGLNPKKSFLQMMIERQTSTQNSSNKE